jgi:laminin G domain protein
VTVLVLALAADARAAGRVAAHWRLNDRPGSVTMRDSSRHHISGRIASTAADEGLTLNGFHYHWAGRCPGCPPVQRGRVIRVPDRRRLEIPVASVRYSLAFRFKASQQHFGNLMEKGHSTARGGQIKVQAHKGMIQCLFKGANGTEVGTNSGKTLNDGDWHVVKCVHTPHRVVEYVDGARVDSQAGATGPINNKKPLTIGGKLNCDQSKVTCDYFSGSMDWISIRHG